MSVSAPRPVSAFSIELPVQRPSFVRRGRFSPPRRTRSSSGRSSPGTSRATPPAAPAKTKVTCRARRRCSPRRCPPPRIARRRASSPQVIGLTKPSGGGGVYAELILRSARRASDRPGSSCPSRSVRPAGSRAPSRATSNGFGANIAPKTLTTRSKLSSASVEIRASPSWNRRFARPFSCGAPVPGRDEVARDVHAEDVGSVPRCGQRGGAVAAAQVEDLRCPADAEGVRPAPRRSRASSRRCG